MTILCIGDSLTEGDYGVKGKRGIANVKADNYPKFLADISGCKVCNFGKCGYTSASYLEYYSAGNVTVKDADIILIMLGTNGGMSGNEETAGNRAYDKLCRLLRQDYPKAQTVLITPPHATADPAYSNCGYRDRVDGAVRFVREYAKANKYPLIDLASYSEFCDENEKIYQPNDGLHYGKAGYRKMAEYINNSLIGINDKYGRISRLI